MGFYSGAEVNTEQTQTHAKVRLTIDVAYTLNGESAALLADGLEHACAHSIAHGLLTGSSAACVDTHTVAAVVLHPPLSEEEVAAAWAA